MTSHAHISHNVYLLQTVQLDFSSVAVVSVSTTSLSVTTTLTVKTTVMKLIAVRTSLQGILLCLSCWYIHVYLVHFSGDVGLSMFSGFTY